MGYLNLAFAEQSHEEPWVFILKCNQTIHCKSKVMKYNLASKIIVFSLCMFNITYELGQLLELGLNIDFKFYIVFSKYTLNNNDLNFLF